MIWFMKHAKPSDMLGILYNTVYCLCKLYKSPINIRTAPDLVPVCGQVSEPLCSYVLMSQMAVRSLIFFFKQISFIYLCIQQSAGFQSSKVAGSHNYFYHSTNVCKNRWQNKQVNLPYARWTFSQFSLEPHHCHAHWVTTVDSPHHSNC